jgi:Ca-activated chloride channel homolog
VKKFDLSWLEFEYLSPDTFMGYEWVNSTFLYLMPFAPILFLLSWLIFLRSRPTLHIVLPSGNSKDWTVFLRFIPTFFLLVFVELVLVALARPQKVREVTYKSSSGVEIVLALDISESMAGLDLEPNRLEAAKVVAREFIDGRKSDKVGVVVFSGEAFTLCPLTSDYSMLKQLVSKIDFGMIDADGTAIGTAIATATNRMRDSKAKSKVMILISDGESNAGQLNPITAARLSSAFGIKIYTIAVGKDGDVEYKDENGESYIVNNQLNEGTLRQIAEIGQGKFERANSNDALSKIFKQIDAMEKSETKVTHNINAVDYYQVYLYWAILSFLIWLGLKSSFMSNILVD